MINIEEAKKKYLMPSDLKIAICNVDDIKDMITTIESLQQQLEKAEGTIRELKKKTRYQKYMQLEQENLAMAREIETYKEIISVANESV